MPGIIAWQPGCYGNVAAEIGGEGRIPCEGILIKDACISFYCHAFFVILFQIMLFFPPLLIFIVSFSPISFILYKTHLNNSFHHAAHISHLASSHYICSQSPFILSHTPGEGRVASSISYRGHKLSPWQQPEAATAAATWSFRNPRICLFQSKQAHALPATEIALL